MSLSKRDAERLNRILGMMGSEHAGERASAALAADKLVRESGLSWAELLAGPAAQPGRRKTRDYGIDYIEAAENRARVLRAENERLARQNLTLRRRIARLLDRLRAMEPVDEESTID